MQYTSYSVRHPTESSASGGWFSFGILMLSFISFLLEHVGKERLKHFVLTLAASKELRYFQYTLLTVFLLAGLLQSVMVYTLVLADGSFYKAVFAFMLMATSVVGFFMAHLWLAKK